MSQISQPINIIVDRDKPEHFMVSPRSQSRSPSPRKKERPWVPAPCKTSKNSYTWNGGKGRLDIGNSAYDYYDDYDDNVNSGSVEQFRTTVDNMANEIDYLKTRSEVFEKQKEIETLKDELNDSLSQTILKDREISTIQEDLFQTELENERLKSNLKYKSEQSREQKINELKIQQERKSLLNRLVEAEADAMVAKREMSALHQAFRELQEEKATKHSDTAKLSEQRDLLMAKCSEAQSNNNTLREELRKNQLMLDEGSKIKEQYAVILERLSHTDAANHELKANLSEMDCQINLLTRQVNEEREETEAYKSLQRSSELSRNKAEERLLECEDDNVRLQQKVQILVGELESERKAHNHTKGLLAGIKDRGHNEKEALREKLRVYRDRALQGEEALETVTNQLEAKRIMLAQLEDDNIMLTTKIDNLVGEKTDLSDTSHNLERKLYICQEKLKDEQQEYRGQVSHLKENLDDLMSKQNILESKNKQLTITVNSLRDKLKDKDNEVATLISTMGKDKEKQNKETKFYKERAEEVEGVLSRYKTDNTMLQNRCETAEREMSAIQHDSVLQMEKIRNDYQSQINELSILPEKLKTAESKYMDAEESRSMIQEKFEEQNDVVSKLNRKVEALSDQLAKLKQKYQDVNENNMEISNFSQTQERKLFEVEQHNRNLMDLLSKKDQTVEQQQLQIQDLVVDNNSLSQQLESSINDCKRQVDALKEKNQMKERTAASKIDELEAQLTRVTTTTSQLKRLKDEAEKRSQQRINEMRERLEQANNTTRSMQNYVNFLKQSYSNVFGETSFENYSASARLSPNFRKSPTPRSLNFEY